MSMLDILFLSFPFSQLLELSSPLFKLQTPGLADCYCPQLRLLKKHLMSGAAAAILTLIGGERREKT